MPNVEPVTAFKREYARLSFFSRQYDRADVSKDSVDAHVIPQLIHRDQGVRYGRYASEISNEELTMYAILILGHHGYSNNSFVRKLES